MPIRKGDGTNISALRLGNGTNIAEVRKGDGTILWSADAIPDSGDLQARYDATELSLNDGDTVSTWVDETENGHDLTAGTAPTFKKSIINGNPVVRFDGVDNFLNVAWAALTQPNHIFVVYQMVTVDDSAGEWIHDGYSSATQVLYAKADGNFTLYAGNDLTGAATDTNPHINAELFDGSNSVYRQDGTQVGSGDVGTNDMDGLTLGVRGDEVGFANMDVGEILVYPQDKSSIVADVESYLSDKWGITI